jgi:HEAT repeat protein
MKNRIFNRILLIGLIAAAACTAGAAEERELIAVLKSEAGVVEKCAACQQLRICGTAESVPALAAQLGDERVGHAARHALEGMPYAEAGAALRDAIGKTSGAVKAGLIDSVGWRGDTAAVGLLAPLVSDADTAVATAAATALGRMGGKDAETALVAACGKVKGGVRDAVFEAILRCAEGRLSSGDSSGAAGLYRKVMEAEPGPVMRLAAWRGLALSDGSRRDGLVVEALGGRDAELRLVAIRLVREMEDEQLIKACLRQWRALPADAQVLLVDVMAARGDHAFLADIVKACTSPDEAVRVAAVKAVGVLGDAANVALLAERAGRASGGEQAAARESLRALRGKDIQAEMMGRVEKADSAVRVELIQALADRGATEATPLLLKAIRRGDAAVRAASYRALRELAGAEQIGELVGLLLEVPGGEQKQLESAIVGAARRTSASAAASKAILAKLDSVQEAKLKAVMIGILGQLGDASALATLRRALGDDAAEIRYAAIQGLSAWPTAEPKDDLLRVAKTSDNATHKVLALRGYIDLIGKDASGDDAKLAMYQEAMTLATQAAEKKRVLSGLTNVRTVGALEMAAGSLDQADVCDEAAFAAVTIAAPMAARQAQAVKAAMEKVAASAAPEEIRKQAAAIVEQITTIQSYLMDWEVSGPYVQDGKDYAALFDIAFAPENDAAAAQWRPMPVYADSTPAGYLDLLRALDGGDSRVAYLRTTIDSDADKAVTFEIFSDDGVKAWLNGQIILSLNVARPIMPTPDAAKATLKKGANALVLKITQNNMPWGAIVRMREPAPEVVKVGKQFRIVVINAESKFEAAGICDVNKDGKLDIVSGGSWYEAPQWKQHFIREVQYEGGYYYDFASLPMDIDGDGWTDIAGAAWHNKKVFWVRNPGDSGKAWEVIDVDEPGNMETALAFDINGDGQMDILPNIMSQAAWYEFGRDASAPHGVRWTKHPLPQEAAGHGNGAGDVNGDGRMDVVAPKGWVEQPADASGEWTWHGEFDLGQCSVPALVHDVDGDKDVDIIYGFGHNYGLFWLEQGKDAAGGRTWTRHLIDDSWSQPHFMLLADVDNDGKAELVTGKRYYAHNGNDPGENDPKCVYYYTWDGARWQRHLIHEGGMVAFGINTQAADIDGDGDLDIVAPGKSGLYLLENTLK